MKAQQTHPNSREGPADPAHGLHVGLGLFRLVIVEQRVARLVHLEQPAASSRNKQTSLTRDGSFFQRFRQFIKFDIMTREHLNLHTCIFMSMRGRLKSGMQRAPSGDSRNTSVRACLNNLWDRTSHVISFLFLDTSRKYKLSVNSANESHRRRRQQR